MKKIKTAIINEWSTLLRAEPSADIYTMLSREFDTVRRAAYGGKHRLDPNDKSTLTLLLKEYRKKYLLTGAVESPSIYLMNEQDPEIVDLNLTLIDMHWAIPSSAFAERIYRPESWATTQLLNDFRNQLVPIKGKFPNLIRYTSKPVDTLCLIAKIHCDNVMRVEKILTEAFGPESHDQGFHFEWRGHWFQIYDVLGTLDYTVYVDYMHKGIVGDMLNVLQDLDLPIEECIHEP